MDSMMMEAHWLNETTSCSLLTLTEVSGLSSADLQWLVESGALTPLCAPDQQATLAPDETQPAFPAQALQMARLARRLREDFELDNAGLAVALRLLQRIDALEQEVDRLRARLPGRRHE